MATLENKPQSKTTTSQKDINNEIFNITSFTLKGSSFPLTVIQILDSDLKKLDKELNHKTRQAPNFFKNVPVVLDLMKISLNDELNNKFDLLKTQICLKKNGLVIAGISNATAGTKELATKNNIAILPDTNQSSSKQNKTKSKKSSATSQENNLIINSKLNNIESINDRVEEVDLKNKIITTPVRSGQQIYAQGFNCNIICWKWC